MLNQTVKGYKLISRIGNGASGTVYEATKDNKIYAIKVIDIAKNEKIYSLIKEEAKKGKEIDNENIVKVYDSFEIKINGEDFYIIVMEKCNNKNLRDYIYSDNYQPTYEKTIKLIKQILFGIKEIHKHNIIHRDLKPENILLSDDKIKIYDFGLSKYTIEQSKFSSTVGTKMYYSPQIVNNEKYSNKTDIWSAGIICYELVNKKYPFMDIEKETEFQMYERIKLGKYLEMNSNINENIKELIQMMLKVDEKERPDINILLDKIDKMTRIELNGNDKIAEKLNDYNIEHLILKDFKIDSLSILNMIKYPNKIENLEIINIENLKKIEELKLLPNLKNLTIKFCDEERNDKSLFKEFYNYLGNFEITSYLFKELSKTIYMYTKLRIDDFSPISKCNKLEILKLFNTNISDISILENNKNLKELDLIRCFNIKDINPIFKLDKLEILDLEHTEISDISFLENNKNIKLLGLTECLHIKDFNPISKLDKLEILDLEFTGVSDISFLENNKNIKLLILYKCWWIKDFNPLFKLDKLDKLEVLNLGDTKISDISFLENNKNIKFLCLFCCQNIKDINPISKLDKLKILILSYSNISDISFLKNNNNIKLLRLDECKNIKDFNPISKLDKLEILSLNNTNISDISFLENNKNLKKLELKRCENIKDTSIISKLKENDNIIVNY